MAIKFKPIYICEGCATETEDPDQVRIFSGIIVNGEGTKQFVSSEKMYCLDCIPLALDFKNVVPVTVEIVDSKLTKVQNQETVSKNYEELNEIKTELLDIKQTNLELKSILNNITSNITLNNSRLSVIEELILNTEKQITEEKCITEEQIYQEPEIITKNIHSETKKNIFDSLETTTTGKFLILQLIDDCESEKEFATKYGYENLKDLQNMCGLENLIGLYYSSDTHIDELPKSFSKKSTVKLINRIIYGIPSIVSKEVYINHLDLESRLAIIENKYLVDKIEAVAPLLEKLKNSEPQKIEELEKIELGFHEVEQIPKKSFSFSRKSTSDDYI